MPVIDLTDKELTELPTDNDEWEIATIIILRGNQIRELDTSFLPETLEYLDLSDNPLERIVGDFTRFPKLQRLILENTALRKLTRLRCMNVFHYSSQSVGVPDRSALQPLQTFTVADVSVFNSFRSFEIF